MYSSFSNCNSLLFHDLVDCYTISVVHFIEFVDAHDATVRQDHRTSFQAPLASVRIGRYGGRQTDPRRPSARGIDGEGGEAQDETQELRLGGRRVADEAQVDVAAQFDPVLLALLVHAAEQPGVW